MLERSLTLGIDPSLNSAGLVVLDEDGGVAWADAIRPKGTGWARLMAHQTAMIELLSHFDVDSLVAGVEAYAIAARGNALHAMVEVGMVYRLTLSEYGIPWFAVNPGSLKKFTTGHGSAGKTEMMARIERRWGFSHPIEDVAEAYAIARWVIAHRDAHEASTPAACELRGRGYQKQRG